MKSVTKVTVLGPTGRLGRAICAAVLDAPDMELVGAIVRSQSAFLDEDVGEMLDRDTVGCRTTVPFEDALGLSDIVIDASMPAMTISVAERMAVQARKCGLVTGVTGFTTEQSERLATAAQRVPLLAAGNFSLGIAVIEALVEQAAILPAKDWDIEISETHHRLKADAPSGTALLLGHAAARGRGINHEAMAVWAREGVTGPRRPGTIGYAVSRGGGIIGEHEVRLLSDMEEISISHRTHDRRVFARGAITATRWMFDGGKGREPGLYSMQDVVKA
ncbi:4-hydroxy-tetrahydrodipicolinate reductase [Maricaulis salignorans]|uniref:4-hydroxy-tetrahydrodipicolinate reductase n=1 Tax=Maricaulis salignorans TaxID=144026 RepID=UPI003A947174